MQNCARNGGFCINIIPPRPPQRKRHRAKKRMGPATGARMGRRMGGRMSTRTRKGNKPKPSPRAVGAQHNVLPKGVKPTIGGVAGVQTQTGFMPQQRTGLAPQAPGLMQFTGYAPQPSAFPQNTGYAQKVPAFPQNTGYVQQAPTFPQNNGYARQVHAFPQNTGYAQQVPTFPQNNGFAPQPPQAPVSWQTTGFNQQPAPATQSNTDPFAGLFGTSNSGGMSQLLMMGLLSRKKRQAQKPKTGPIAPLFEPGEEPKMMPGQSVYSFLDQTCLKAKPDPGCKPQGGICCTPHAGLL